jgi:hypothetical protein
MASLKLPELIIHPLFSTCEVEQMELVHAVKMFCDGDSGEFSDEDEILGFMDKSLRDKVRHGVYETESGGRVHVVGDNARIAIYPDIIFAMTCKGLDCTINTCNCFEKVFSSTPTPNEHPDKV